MSWRTIAFNVQIDLGEWRRLLLRVLLWTGLLLLVLVIAYAVWWRTLKTRYESRLELLRRAGVPVTTADLAPPPVPEEENGAPFLMKAHAWYQSETESRDEPYALILKDANERSEEDWKEIERFVDRCEPYLALIEHGVAKPHVRFDLEWERGPEMMIPAFPLAMDASELLAARTHLAARRGDHELAARSLGLMLDVAGIQEHSSTICYLVRITVQRKAVHTLIAVSGEPEFDPKPYRSRLGPRLDRAGRPSALSEALVAERALAVWVYDAMLRGESPEYLPDLEDWVLSSWIGRPFLYLDALKTLDTLDAAIELSRRPPRELTDPYRELATRADEREFPYLVSGMFCVLFEKLLAEHMRAEARIGLARIGLAALSHRDQAGKWPGKLSVLGGRLDGRLPTDPFTGDSYKFEKTEQGVRISSAAPVGDGEDRDWDEVAWELR